MTGDVIIRRSLARVAEGSDTAAIRVHAKSIQDTGIEWLAEVNHVIAVNKLSAAPVTAISGARSAMIVALKGNDDALKVEKMNALVDLANQHYPRLISEQRELYSDMQVELKPVADKIGISPGLDEKVVESAYNKIRLTNLKEADHDFITAVTEFEAWLKTQEQWNYTFIAWRDDFLGDRATAEEVDAEKTTPGIVTLGQLRQVAPVGTTGGQRYTPEKRFGDTHSWHVSISFEMFGKLEAKPSKRKIRITSFHASFERRTNGVKAYYWWRKTGEGAFVYNERQGQGHLEGMSDLARPAVTAAAEALGCTA